ncbi:DUF502 domain-containing protein [Stenotrophobium rhamnosiphilum]|uniref:DUF502 domain-containing protein n=1 Tax=Stenotrophobium rhamnosiphilum TaxID=2029166 RepID=A0A2T5MHG1_9GAMM|nr:DUF502 domain-containing protein [Stenotrophobium rhamnosiphilum]PTU32008.1 hypothetical protein CJD38_04840 [Stenotrophobium rhamnosiphilum]
MNRLLRRWFIAGLLIWLPLAVTLLVIRFVVNILDTSLLLLPAALRPDFPGFGVLLSIVLVLGTGALAANYIGRRGLSWAESALGHIPLVRSVYGGMKKLAETLFSGNAVAFRHALLIRYPHAGTWSIAFQTADTPKQLQDQVGQELVTVFVPTTPNPTSGFLLLVPKQDVIWLEMPVEEALRLVISLGVVAPDVEKLTAYSAQARAANAVRG